MEIEEFIKENYPDLSLTSEEAKALYLGNRVLEKELGNSRYKKSPSADTAELLYTAKRDLALLAHQQKFEVNNKSWKEILALIIISPTDNHPILRLDAVYKVVTSKGGGILVVCTGKDFHYFSFYADKGFPPDVYHLMCIGEYEIDKQTPGKIEADLKRITETEKEFRDPLEAKNWINDHWVNVKEGQDGPFASHIFSEKEEALEFVEKLYHLGAEKVTVGNINSVEENVFLPYTHYADSLIVLLPKEDKKRESIFSYLNNIGKYKELDAYYKEEGQKNISLFWDY